MKIIYFQKILAKTAYFLNKKDSKFNKRSFLYAKYPFMETNNYFYLSLHWFHVWTWSLIWNNRPGIPACVTYMAQIVMVILRTKLLIFMHSSIYIGIIYSILFILCQNNLRPAVAIFSTSIFIFSYFFFFCVYHPDNAFLPGVPR